MFAEQLKSMIRIPYALRRVPEAHLVGIDPSVQEPRAGDIALGQLEKIGKNTRLELADGRMATLHEGDRLLVVFGNRYATEQFEGYARADGDSCHLLSQGGLCGIVASRHASIPEPSRLRLLGSVVGPHKRAIRMQDYALPPVVDGGGTPRVTVVCGTSMDSGKTYTTMSMVIGLRRLGIPVAAIKLTGTSAGRDTWSYFDAGARPALDFSDAGLPSTYLCGLRELLDLHRFLLSHAGAGGAAHVVIEVADGLLQQETAALLQSDEFMSTVDRIVFATGDPLGAAGGIHVLRAWGIEPAAISGLISMSPLAMREAHAATGVRCVTAPELQAGVLEQADPSPAVVTRRAVCIAAALPSNGKAT